MVVRDEKQFGEAIRKARRDKGWRQAELARRAGVYQRQISDIENGVVSPRLEMVFKLVAALALDMTLAERRGAAFDPEAY